jgi:hypothetical protein
MPFTAAAIGAGISAAGSIAGGLLQKGAVSQGQSEATGAIQQGIQTATNQLSPWATTGVTANTQEGGLLGLNGQPATDAAISAFQNTPGYQFDFQQGLRATDAGAAALGDARSGAAIKAEQTFGTGLADNTFNNYWNHLQQLSSNGLTAAGGIANAATGGATNIANTDIGAAGADASIYGNIAKGIGTGANQLLSSPSVQTWLNGGVSPTTAYNNGLYQQAQFAQQPAGTFGPFAPVS